MKFHLHQTKYKRNSFERLTQRRLQSSLDHYIYICVCIYIKTKENFTIIKNTHNHNKISKSLTSNLLYLLLVRKTKFEDNVSIESSAVTFQNEVKNNDHNFCIEFYF